MIATDSHPTLEQLAAFNAGRLNPVVSTEIEQHLADCDSCCQSLKKLPEDSLAGMLRQEVGGAEPAASETANTVEQTIALPSERATLAPGDVGTQFGQAGTVSTDIAPKELANHARYRIVKLLGSGGMGQVFMAEHRLMNRPVALKIINRNLVQNEAAVQRFHREVRAAARLSHPNIVTAYDAEQAGDSHFLVMEFVTGCDLAEEVKQRGPLPVAEACDYIRQAAEGLQHAGQLGMVHRDIKPQNLMVTRGGSDEPSAGEAGSTSDTAQPAIIKILDFGLARFASETGEDASLTNVGSMMGTPDYMAPEQARDARSADIRSDIYSLGCTLHFLLTGQTLHPGGTVIEKIMAHVEREPQPLVNYRHDVPAGLQEILQRMLAKNPVDRFQTPAEVARALAPFASGNAIVSPVSSAATQAAKQPPRSPRVLVAVAASAFAIFVALAGVITVVTDQGRIEIQSEVDDVEIVIKQGGEQIEVIDVTTGSQVTRLPSGEYEIKLKGDRNDVEIKGGNFSLSRWGIAIVTLKRKPEGLAADQTLKSNMDAQKPASHKLSAGWGDFINTDGASDVRESDGRVTITVPAGDRSYWSKQGPGSVPRLMQEVDGDFVAQVKVTLGRDSDKDNLFSASLAVWNNDRDFHTLTFTLYASNDSLSAMRFLDGPRGVTTSGTSGKSRIAHLKIERRNNELTTSWSRDGETWEKTKEPVIVNWPRKVQVGVAVNNRSTDELRVQFEELTITKDAPPPAIAPFNAEQAKKHQDAWAKHLGVPVEYTNSIGMKFVCITPGSFIMGSPKEEKERVPNETQHKVTLTKTFYMGMYAVTQEQWQAVMGSNPSHFKNDKTLPVDQVNWEDCQEFIQKLREIDKKPYRLPTEAEFEFASRAGTTTPFYFGETISTDQANFNGNAVYGNGKAGVHRQKTTPVDSFPANAFGLHDMHGNVWQWCQDWYGDYPHNDVIDPQGTDEGSHRILRGGSWMGPPSACRSAGRGYRVPFDHVLDFGFRLALSVDEVKPAIKSAVQDWKGWPKDDPVPAIAPFDVEQAKQHQEAWAKHLSVPVEYANSLGMKFRLIPPGEYLMGSTPAEIEEALKIAADSEFAQLCAKSEGPQHKVILSQPHYVGIYEVTQAQYEKVMGKNPSHFAATGPGKDAVIGLDTTNHPVEFVSWHEAVAFCAKLSQQEKMQRDNSRRGDDKTQLNGVGYRLLTEAEWEFSCRAGSTMTYSSGDGDEQLDQIAWIGRNSPSRTHAVGELQPNPFGLHDLQGNVWEWCQDPWELMYYSRFQEQPALDPNGPPPKDDVVRIGRGGAYGWPSYSCRASFRSMQGPLFQNNQIGFRVSLSVEAVRKAIEQSTKIAKDTSPLASLKDSATVLMYLNNPKNNTGGSVPVALLGREGRVAFRFGNWLVVFEGIVCDPKAAILGFSNFNIPLRGSSGEGTLDFGAGDKLPGVLIKYKFADEQNEIAINNNRFKLRGKATRLEFGDKTYDATNSVQTILVARDGSTKLETPKNSDVTPEAAKGVSQNLITDPSFEKTGLTQLPRDWRAWANEDSDFRCEVVNGGHTGQRSLRVSGKGIRGVVFGNDLKADRTKRYALKGWAKFEGDKDARALIKLNYFRGSEFLGVHDLIGVTADQPGWHLLEKTDALDVYPQADHFYAMCHVEGSGTGWFDDLELVAYDRDKLPNDFDVRHGRHNRLTGPNSLHRWAGTWDTEYAFRETDNSPQETKLSMTTTSERTLGDYFLMSHSKAKPPAGDERLQFLLFDQNLGAFRQWIFSSNGKVFEWRGPWNNEKQTLELRMLPDASNLHSSEHFVDDDHIEAKLKFQYVMGQRDAGRWTATRKAVDGKVDVPIAKTHVAEPELSQLNKFAGEWTIRARYKPSVWNPQPREETIREASSWILGGRFLMTRALNEKDELTSIWIATYEPMEKSNRFWFFNADGSSGEWRLTWDEASSGFHFRAVDTPAGWVGTGFNRWINDDTFDNQALIKDENGRVLLDSTQDKRRKK